MSESTRDRIVEMVRQMRENTVARGCTPGEAAKFAAKAAELIEQHQIGEAELRAESGAKDEMEVVENILGTGKKVHNPGMTAVVNGLSRGMCCKVILLSAGWKGRADAAYGIVGEPMDADYVCQIACLVVPALQIMATMEGREHGEEKAGLVRWSNQYLIGAAEEILNRLEKDRHDRSEAMRVASLMNTPTCTALAVITGESLAIVKRKSAEDAMKELYPVTRKVSSRQKYDHEAQQRGRAAGKTVGLRLQID